MWYECRMTRKRYLIHYAYNVFYVIFGGGESIRIGYRWQRFACVQRAQVLDIFLRCRAHRIKMQFTTFYKKITKNFFFFLWHFFHGEIVLKIDVYRFSNPALRDFYEPVCWNVTVRRCCAYCIRYPWLQRAQKWKTILCPALRLIDTIVVSRSIRVHKCEIYRNAVILWPHFYGWITWKVKFLVCCEL